jgi:hypothetical protein
MLISAGQLSYLKDTKCNVQTAQQYQPDISIEGIFQLILKINLYNYQLFDHYLQRI